MRSRCVRSRCNSYGSRDVRCVCLALVPLQEHLSVRKKVRWLLFVCQPKQDQRHISSQRNPLLRPRSRARYNSCSWGSPRISSVQTGLLICFSVWNPHLATNTCQARDASPSPSVTTVSSAGQEERSGHHRLVRDGRHERRIVFGFCVHQRHLRQDCVAPNHPTTLQSRH